MNFLYFEVSILNPVNFRILVFRYEVLHLHIISGNFKF